MAQLVITTHQLKRWALALKQGYEAVAAMPESPETNSARVELSRAIGEVRTNLALASESIPDEE